jgi:hypothetical protein
MGDGLRRCAACRAETSVTAGTILAGTRTPLVSWFAAVWYVSTRTGRQRARAAAGARPGQLPHGVVVAAQAQARDGGTRPRAARWRRRGRRDDHRRLSNRRQARSRGPHKVLQPRHHQRRRLRRPRTRTSCPKSTASPACSSAGCWGPTRAPSLRSRSTTTSTNLSFASTAVDHGTAAFSSIAFWRVRSPLIPTPIGCSSTNQPTDQAPEPNRGTEGHSPPLQLASGHAADRAQRAAPPRHPWLSPHRFITDQADSTSAP